jgi:uncharacterized protein (DUF433 family)
MRNFDNFWRGCSALESDPARMSGAWVFRGTRVPVDAFFENIKDGATIDDFLAWFPGVVRKQVEVILQFAIESLRTAPNRHEASVADVLRLVGKVYEGLSSEEIDKIEWIACDRSHLR